MSWARIPSNPAIEAIPVFVAVDRLVSGHGYICRNPEVPPRISPTNCQCFRPSLMSISADHIVGKKKAIRMKSAMDFIEEKFQFDKMMQTLDCQDDVILPGGFPGIDVERRKLKIDRQIPFLTQPFSLDPELRRLRSRHSNRKF